ERIPDLPRRGGGGFDGLFAAGAGQGCQRMTLGFQMLQMAEESLHARSSAQFYPLSLPQKRSILSPFAASGASVQELIQPAAIPDAQRMVIAQGIECPQQRSLGDVVAMASVLLHQDQEALQARFVGRAGQLPDRQLVSRLAVV